MKHTAELLFPTLINIIETDVNDKIKPYCLKAKETDPVGVALTNSGGWQSKGNLENSLITDSLYQIFEKTINNLYIPNLKIINHWININGPSNFNVLHDHPMSELSGVYYVDVPENSGEIYFENPQCFKQYAELSAYKKEFAQTMKQHINNYIQPKEGLLLIFPSHLKHGVTPNQSDKDRISISFNIRMVG